MLVVDEVIGGTGRWFGLVSVVVNVVVMVIVKSQSTELVISGLSLLSGGAVTCMICVDVCV